TGEWIEEEPVVEYPASLPNVISIGATIESDHRKDWDPDPEVPDWGSCYDGHLSIMAPGINIPSTDLEAYSENKYLNSFLGTSAAAPHVAGVVALMLSVKSDLTVQQIQDILAKSADFYPFMNSDEYGAGRLNAYKALLLALAYDNKSVNDNATATNSGRKVVLDNSGNSHLVFSSGDEIFYRKNNGTWQYPVGLSNNEGENKYPSIAGYSDGSTNRLYVTWQREDTENGDYEIWLAVSSNGGSSWDQFIIDNIEPGTDPKPVIAASCSTNSSVMIAYIDGNSGSVAGLKSKYTTTSIPSSSTSWDTDNISGSNHRNPTLTSFATGSTSYYAIVYETTTYKPELHYRYFSPYGNYWSSSTNLASSYSTGDQHLNPSITVEPGTDNIHVAWEHKFWSGYQREYIAHRKTNQYYYWSSSCNDITHTSAERPTISATSSGATHLIFEAYTDNLYRYTYNGSYWSYSGYVAGSSDHPSLSTGQNSAKYVWTSQSGPQYQINLSSSALSKKMKADPAFYSSRSILLTSEDDSYIQIIQHPVYLSENGTKKLIKMNDFEVDSNSVKLNDLYKLTELKDFMSEDPTAEVEIYYSVKTNDLNSLKKIYRDILGYGNGIRFRTTDASLNNIEPLENEGHYYYDSLSVKIPVSSLKKNYSGNYELGMQLKDFKQHGFKFESVGNIYDYPDDAGLLKEKENAGLASASPQKYQLNLSNYPNPFNPTTLIEYEIPEDAQISIKLYNMLGQMVGELVNTEKAAGRYSVQLDASDLASGVYVYTLSTPKFHASKKMLLIK
ncbi:MAG: S8 family serine peptidase, partial [Melioribacteraceae bacterium]|nr:S8 family serine peptidase [Melioribacteraceae bacterium]